MPSRTRSRQRALQILFLLEARGQPVEEAIDAYYSTLFQQEQPAQDAFAAELVRGAAEHIAELDALIAKHAAHWRLERMPAVDRNILRLAGYELKYGVMPAAVIIDEALELARKFSGEESAPFVNGVLDAMQREVRAQEAAGGEAAG